MLSASTLGIAPWIAFVRRERGFIPRDTASGGLGVYLVCTLMDEASYRREGGRNRLALVERGHG